MEILTSIVEDFEASKTKSVLPVVSDEEMEHKIDNYIYHFHLKIIMGKLFDHINYVAE
jgi:hypothetical protein